MLPGLALAYGIGSGVGDGRLREASLLGVGWSRMNDEAHWASDVLVGGALGTVTTRSVYRARRRRRPVE